MSKVSKLKSAILYATSLYKGAVESKKAEETHNDAQLLLHLLNEGIDGFDNLNNPTWSLDIKFELVDTLSQKLKISAPMTNMLKILVENRRMNDLVTILQNFENIYYKEKNIAKVEVETTIALSAQQDKALKQKLKTLFDKEILVEYINNPQIIGGLVIRCGTVLIDCSVKHQLDSLEQLMKGTK